MAKIGEHRQYLPSLDELRVYAYHDAEPFERLAEVIENYRDAKLRKSLTGAGLSADIKGKAMAEVEAVRPPAKADG